MTLTEIIFLVNEGRYCPALVYYTRSHTKKAYAPLTNEAHNRYCHCNFFTSVSICCAILHLRAYTSNLIQEHTLR